MGREFVFHPLVAETQRQAVFEKRAIRRGGERSRKNGRGGGGTVRNVETVISGMRQ